MVPFNTGMLVNRIFTNTINGHKENAQQMRESIDSNSRNDKYSSISQANMKFENELKNLAIR